MRGESWHISSTREFRVVFWLFKAYILSWYFYKEKIFVLSCATFFLESQIILFLQNDFTNNVYKQKVGNKTCVDSILENVIENFTYPFDECKKVNELYGPMMILRGYYQFSLNNDSNNCLHYCCHVFSFTKYMMTKLFQIFEDVLFSFFLC